MPPNQPTATHQTGLPARSLSQPQTTRGITAGPQSSAPPEIPLIGSEVENNHHTNDAAPEMDPPLEETNDEQPLLPN